MIVLLAAGLEENAQAGQNGTKVQAVLDSVKTVRAGADPVQVMSGWNTTIPSQNLTSKTLDVKVGGITALDALKQQTSRIVRSLRSTNGIAEGRFDPPGLSEFSAYMGRSGATSESPEAREQNIDTLRLATIRSIEKVLGQSPSQEQRIDLLLRLAELHSERYTYFLVREMSQYEKAHDKWEKNHRSGPEPKILLAQSQRSMNSATEILRRLVNQFPNHQRTPEALYQLGFLLTEMKSDSATLYFQRLLERFPKSKFVPDALLALGEFYFSRNKFADAQVYYQKILSDRNHHVYPYAVYKLGWTFFNIRGSEQEIKINLEKSLAAFKLVVRIATAKGSKDKLSFLRKDALRDMVLVFAEMGTVDEAQQYFKSIGEYSLYTSLLERLAWLHADAGRHREAIEIYSRLIFEFPDGARNPVYYARLAALYDKEQNRQLLVESLQQFSSSVSQGSPWWNARRNAKERDEARNLLASESHLWGLRLHAEFQKTKNRSTAQSAGQLYQIALTHQNEAATSYVSLFNKAQLHSVLEEHEKAVDAYLRLALLDKKHSLQKKETKIALENAIAESDILIEQRRSAGAQPKGQMPSLEHRLVKLIDLHAALYPKAPERAGLQHRAALIHNNAGLSDAASRRWTALAREYPQSAFVSEGLRLVIKRSYDAQDWLKAAADARGFLALPAITSAPVGAQLRKLLSVAIFQQGLHLEKERRYTDASRQFLAFHKEFSADVDAPKALINAANNQFRDNRPEEALATLKIFVDTYPSSELYIKALEMVAMTSQSMGMFADAARAAELMAKRKPAGEPASLAHIRAAELLLAAGNPQAAVSNASLALPHLKRAEDVCETYKILYDAQEALRSTSLYATSLTALNKCQNTSPEWGLYFGGVAAKQSLSAGNSSEAMRLAAQTLARGKRAASKLQNTFAFEGLRLAGQVQLGLLEAQSRQLLTRRVRNTGTLQVDFSLIRNDAEKLVQKYAELVQSGQPEASVAAIYRVGEIQEGLASILVQTPLAQGTSPAEGEAIRTRIEKIAIPLQEEAGKLYSQALSKSEELEVVTSYSKQLREKLSLLRPSDFRITVEAMPNPSYFMHELPLRDEVKEVVDESK
jgi:tetratricopeptide (TPR) repeat protein